MKISWHPIRNRLLPALYCATFAVLCGLAPTLASAGWRAVIINGERLDEPTIQALEGAYRVRILDGRYWYDPATGAWGFERGPAVAFILPGLALGGPLQADASGGGTGVFINGRELHPLDVAALYRITGRVLPGRFWVDRFGNGGYEGGPALFNLVALARASGAAQGGAWSHYSSSGDTSVGGDGQGFTYFMGKDSSGNITSYTGP